MSKGAFLLDTSALLTLIEDEDGADRVEHIFRRESTVLPWLVLLEMYYISLRSRSEAVADQRLAMIKHVTDEIVWQADVPTMLKAAQFKALHRVSLVDAIIAAVAATRGAILVHKDPEYESLTGFVEMEVLPYK